MAEPTWLLWLLLASLAMQPSAATEYTVNINTDTPGGQRFNTDFSDAVTVLSSATQYIQSAFSLSPLKDIPTVTLIVESFDGVAQTGGSTIQLSSDYVANTDPADAVAMHYEIAGVLYHEMTHVWQNNNGLYGSDQFFSGTIEGVADWVRLKAGFPSVGWPPRARGGEWFSGYTTTAYFLDWIETTVVPNFVNMLNAKMAEPWSNDFFLQIAGRSVDELWNDYQNSI
jgi:hypothetical protein